MGGSAQVSAQRDLVAGNKIETTNIYYAAPEAAKPLPPLNRASPYRGLKRFTANDAALFFGRDSLITSLARQIATTNVLLVMGASGSGKSSVVRAGLLPRLAAEQGKRLRSFPFEPDKKPFRKLGLALENLGEFQEEQLAELYQERSDPARAAQLIHNLQPAGEDWILFVDQFEEVFTRCDEPTRRDFLAFLIAIAHDARASTKLILAMRADFSDRFSPFSDLLKIIGKNLEFVADLTEEELRQAIEQPAARHGVAFEPGLVNQIIKDVHGQAGSLPLLQYTLDVLWQVEAGNQGLDDRMLNLDTYQKLGGVLGALEKRANDTFQSLGDAAAGTGLSQKQKIVRKIFLRLVKLTGLSENEATDRPVRRRAPESEFPTPEEKDVLQKLTEGNLVVRNRAREGTEATVEVAHEALFSSWGVFKQWINDGRQAIIFKTQLSSLADLWQKAGARAEEELLSGTRLTQALEMRAAGDFAILGGLGERVDRFLDASWAKQQRRAREEEERRQQELEQERRLREEQSARAREAEESNAKLEKRGRLLLFAGAVAAVLCVLSAVAWRKSVQSEKAAIESKDSAIKSEKAAIESRKVAEKLVDDASRSDHAIAQSRLAEGKWQEAVAYLGRSLLYNKSNGNARDALWLALAYGAHDSGDSWRDPILQAGNAGLPDFDPIDGQIVTAWNTNALIHPTVKQEPRLILSHKDPVTSVQFSPDGGRVLTTSGRTAQIWDAKTGANLQTLDFPEAPLLSAQFSPDGKRIATVSKSVGARETAVQVWEQEDTGWKLKHDWLKMSQRHRPGFHPDGTRLLLVNWTNQVRVRNLADGNEDESFRLAGDPLVREARYSPDGTFLLTTFTAKNAQLWDATNGQRLGQAVGQDDEIVSFGFSGDGSRLVTAGTNGTAQVWSVITSPGASGPLPAVRPLGGKLRHTHALVGAGFSRVGNTIVTVTSEGAARFWSASRGASPGIPLLHGENVGTASFSPDGKSVTTLGQKKARTWNWETGALEREDAAPAQPSGDQKKVLSPDGKHGASWGPRAEVWRTDKEDSKQTLPQKGFVNRARFSPDSKWLVTASVDQMARVWSTADWTSRSAELAHDANVFNATFSPDSGRVVTASEKRAQIWDVKTGQILGPPLRQSLQINDAQYSPDGRLLVTASADMSARVWDVASAEDLGSELYQRIVEYCAGVRLPPGFGVMQVLEGKERLEMEGALLADLRAFPRWRFVLESFLPRTPEARVLPSARVTLREAATRILQSGGAESVHEVLGFDPGHPLLPLALARMEATRNPKRAAFLREYGAKRLPADPEIKRLAEAMLPTPAADNK